jgi:hypothetical protein
MWLYSTHSIYETFSKQLLHLCLTTCLFEEGREWEVAILAVLAVGVGGHSSSVMYGVLPPPTVFPEWKLLTPGQP